MIQNNKNKINDEVRALHQALNDAELKIQALNVMIAVAEEQLKMKKKIAVQSKRLLN
jgi:hypothetical protein